VNSDPNLFLSRCVSIDLEVNPKTAQVFAFAAVRSGIGAGLVHKGGPLDAGLDRLEAVCQDACPADLPP
jgi:ATP-dependent DNA helicase RecQ